MQQDITNRDILNQLNSTRTRQSRSGDNRLTSGLSSSSVRDLETMTRSELLDLKAKNERLLENATLVNTLPDKGAKLKSSLARINSILESGGQEDKMTQRAAALKLEPKKAKSGNSTMLAARGSLSGESSNQKRTRMMSMDESVKLQNENQQRIKDEQLRKKAESAKLRPQTSESLADDLSLTMERMKLNSETGPHRPQDDDPDEYEEDSDDLDSIDEAQYDGVYDDDEGFDEEEYIDERH